MEHDLTHFSLFTGIGGFDLAAEAASFRTVGQVEFADFPHAVLQKHWPEVPKWRDIRTVTGDAVRAAGIGTPTLLSGGFPCQPVSHAGKRKGAADDRWLWPEMFRVVRELRPRWVCGENVTGLIRMGLDGVLSDLESEGYTVRAFIIPAGAVGAPHKRERVFIVAHTERDGREGADGAERGQGAPGLRRRPADAGAAPLPDALRGRCAGHGGGDAPWGGHPEAADLLRAPPGAGDLADAARDGRGEGRAEPARGAGGSPAPLGGLPVPGSAGGPVLADAEHLRLADPEVAGGAGARTRAPAGAVGAEQPARPGGRGRGAAAVADADGQGRGLGGEPDGDAHRWVEAPRRHDPDGRDPALADAAGRGDGLAEYRGGGQGRQPARTLQPAALQQEDRADRSEGALAGGDVADADVVLLCGIPYPRPHETRHRGPWPLPGQEVRGEGAGGAGGPGTDPARHGAGVRVAPELAHPDLIDADGRGSPAGDVRGQLEAATLVRGGEHALGDPALRLPRHGTDAGELADPLVAGWERWLSARAAAGRQDLVGQPRSGCAGGAARWPAGPGQPQHAWEPPRTVESGVGGKSAKFSGRTHRLRALGNAVVPAQVFPILAAIAYYERCVAGRE